jgi:hypothetical protein
MDAPKGAPNGGSDVGPPGPAGKTEPQGGAGNGASNDQSAGEHAGKAEEPGGKSAHLSDDQRIKLKGLIDRGRVAGRVDHPDFSVRVGTVVPRDIRVTVLPTEIVEVVPQYRGYDYILIGDELLIVDPHTLEIVAILEA